MNNFQRKEIYDVTIGFSSLRQGECETDLSHTAVSHCRTLSHAACYGRNSSSMKCPQVYYINASICCSAYLHLMQLIFSSNRSVFRKKRWSLVIFITQAGVEVNK